MSRALCTLALATAPALLGAQVDVHALRTRIESRVRETPAAVVAVAFHDLETGARLDVNPDSMFHAASTMKVPVMIEYFRAVDAGRITPDQGVLLVNQFGSIVDGSPYSLTPGDDSDSSLYRLVGTRVPARELVERMITRSSNLATNAVIALVGAAETDATAHRFGATRIRVLRGVEDNKAFQAGRNNATSAPDLAALLAGIERRGVASFASCNAMLDILSHQEFNEEIPAGVPPGTRVAHKTGWITGVLHDAALVYARGRAPYVLVVLTRGIPDENVARRLIVDISSLVWKAVTGR